MTDQDMPSNTSVLETLLQTNRPPTAQERAVILESMVTNNAKLMTVNAQIEVMKVLIEEAAKEVCRLDEEKAAILDASADHQRVFAPFRNLPEDVLCAIGAACVQGDIPELAFGDTPMPYVLGQICNGMRRAVLRTPLIWASMSIDLGRTSSRFPETYALLARKAIEWFGRAGGLGLTVVLKDAINLYPTFHGSNPDPTSVFFDMLLSYSTRWKQFQFISDCQTLPTPIIRIASLTAADVPILESVSLAFPNATTQSVFCGSKLLLIPTLRRMLLYYPFRSMFTVNWAILTAIVLRSDTVHETLQILQQTQCLELCSIIMNHSEEHYAHHINLPFLKTLVFTEETHNIDLPNYKSHSMLEAITAPILEIFEDYSPFFDLSLSAFLARSPHISQLTLLYFKQDKFFTEMMECLHHCPSLSLLNLQGYDNDCICDANQLLRAFVEEGNDGVICPHLQDFFMRGNCDFSLETLCTFLEKKQGDIAAPDVLQWKQVSIEISGIYSTEKLYQILDLVSQKRAEGLNVDVCQGYLGSSTPISYAKYS